LRDHHSLTEISDQSSIIRQVQALCLQELSIHVASPDEDLFAAGLLDSMKLVQLILHLEECFGFMLPMQELEPESFRSLATIAQLLLSKGSLRQ
jgi:acyl carrier protein